MTWLYGTLDFKFKAGYRACLIQTGHKLTLNLILGPDLVIKNNVSVRSLASTAGVPARKRSRGGRGVPRQHSLAISARIMTHYLITYTKLRANGRNCLAAFLGRPRSERCTRDGACADLQKRSFSPPAANWLIIWARQSYAQILAAQRMC